MTETITDLPTCPVCGGPVKRNKTGRPKMYDTRACRDQAWRSGAAKDARAAHSAAIRASIAASMGRSA